MRFRAGVRKLRSAGTILLDASVWIDHLRRGEPGLIGRLEAGQVLIHPFVLGELALAYSETARTETAPA